MSSTPQTGQLPAPARRNTVIMGRQDFLSVLFRAINAELYKFRRRMMSKVLTIIGVLFVLAGFLVISFTVSSEVNSVSQRSTDSFLPPACALVHASKQPQEPCLNNAPTQADLLKAAQEKQAALQDAAEPLHLPSSFINAVRMTSFIGLFLLIILAGTIVGGEYSVGTIRLVLTRGPTRTQILLAKVGAILVCTALTFLLLVPIGIITGMILLFLQAPQITVSYSFFTGAWLLHALLYLLAEMLGLFMYTMIALCLSTLGKATVAGVAGTIVWWVLESALAGALGLLSSLTRGPLNDFLRAIPDYFIGNNIDTLVTNQTHYLTGSPPASTSDLHALLVLASYLIIFIGLAWWVNQRRDVIN